MPIVAMPIVAVAVVAMTIVAVKPWASADEYATDKPVRTIKAIWSAGVRVIAVVTVGANGGCPITVAVTSVNRTADSNSYRNLRIRIS
jgi:hypothetical protein